MIGSVLRGTIGRRNFYRTSFFKTNNVIVLFTCFLGTGRGGEVLFFMSPGPSLSILSDTCSYLWVLHSAICPSVCQIHAPTLGCSPPPTDISTSHSLPLIPHWGFLCSSGLLPSTLPHPLHLCLATESC